METVLVVIFFALCCAVVAYIIRPAPITGRATSRCRRSARAWCAPAAALLVLMPGRTGKSSRRGRRSPGRSGGLSGTALELAPPEISAPDDGHGQQGGADHEHHCGEVAHQSTSPAANLPRPHELEIGLHICVHWPTAANAWPRIVMIGGVNSHGYAASAANNTAPIDMPVPIDMPAGSRCRVL